MKNVILIAIGGGMGSVMRYFTGHYGAMLFKTWWPVGTLAANVLGCFVIGLIYGLSGRHEWFSPQLRLLLATGFCGGYTTFSTFAFENLQFLESNQWTQFLGYTMSSLIVGIGAVWLGFWVGK